MQTQKEVVRSKENVISELKSEVDRLSQQQTASESESKRMLQETKQEIKAFQQSLSDKEKLIGTLQEDINTTQNLKTTGDDEWQRLLADKTSQLETLKDNSVKQQSEVDRLSALNEDVSQQLTVKQGELEQLSKNLVIFSYIKFILSTKTLKETNCNNFFSQKWRQSSVQLNQRTGNKKRNWTN